VNQDPLGEQGWLVTSSTRNNQISIWLGKLAPRGSLTFAAVLVNLDNTSTLSVELSWDLLPGSVPQAASLAARSLGRQGAGLSHGELGTGRLVTRLP
jgi:hypothetical protein